MPAINIAMDGLLFKCDGNFTAGLPLHDGEKTAFFAERKMPRFFKWKSLFSLWIDDLIAFTTGLFRFCSRGFVGIQFSKGHRDITQSSKKSNLTWSNIIRIRRLHFREPFYRYSYNFHGVSSTC
nr:hypothetical protein [uncultured Oscillibacter sp.]